MGDKQFSERLNTELNAYGFPHDYESRIKAFSKVFSISKHTSSSILSGTILPGNTLLNLISKEFEVSPKWLTGESDKKR